MNEWSNAKLCDVANLILGAILLASPWIFGFPSGAASQNAVVSGIVIAAISIAALAAFTVWEEWLNRPLLFLALSGHGDCSAKCPLMTQSGHGRTPPEGVSTLF